MGKVKGHKVLQQAISEVKDKIKKNKPKTVIKVPEEFVKKKTASKHSSETTFNFKERGIIYLGHIPHGFFEEQIKNFFKQFGTVLRVKVARSKKSGRSKGYAHILFKNISVAKVAADALNNYLIPGRLLKAHYVPKEKQKNLFVFNTQKYHAKNYPRLHNVKKTVLNNHKVVKKDVINKKNYITKKKLTSLEETLKSKGINLSLIST